MTPMSASPMPRVVTAGVPMRRPEAIIGFCRENLAHYKVPRTVVFGPIPKTSTGKIQKFVLRDQARDLAG